MNVPDTEDDSFASRFWESTKRLYSITICYLANLLGCKEGENDEDDLKHPKQKRTTKSTKGIEKKYMKKSIKKSVESVKVVKSFSKSQRPQPTSKKTIDIPETPALKRGIEKDIGSIAQNPKRVNDGASVVAQHPDSTEVRRIKRSNSNKSIAFLLSASRKKSTDDPVLKKGSNGKVKSPGIPTTSKGPDGRVIRLTFVTGFPKMKSTDNHATKVESSEAIKEKRRKASSEAVSEDILIQDELNDIDLDLKDNIKEQHETTTAGKSVTLNTTTTAVTIKEDNIPTSKDVPSEGLTIVKQSTINSSQSITSITSEDTNRAT